MALRRGIIWTRAGLLHSETLLILEKLARKGDEILSEFTLDDRGVLIEPWGMAPRTLWLATGH